MSVLDSVKRLRPLERLVHWIQERDSIRLCRQSNQAKPWTDDPILQSYRFTNVRRMDDKVSKWLYENWYIPYQNHASMLRACALARFFNLPSTLECITETVFSPKWSPSTIKWILRSAQSDLPTIFNSAYMVRGNDGEDKIESVVDYYVGALVKSGVKPDPSSMKETHSRIEGVYGFGSFMAGQVTADLRWAIDGGWEDRDSWAPMGPGSKRGMNRLQERPLDYPLKQSQFLEELLKVREAALKLLPESLIMRLELIDWQNCLCEYDKYERVLWGQGRPKQRYPGM